MLNEIKILEKLFKVNGKTLELTPSQRNIFNSIIGLVNPRVQVLAPTQYGKSLTVALATLIASVSEKERFSILAPTEKKARIIMDYIIDHLFDSEIFLNSLELEQGVTFDRLRRERTRNHLTFKGGGGVMILTLDARNSKRNIEAVMGFGGNRIILDESSLISDSLYSTVKRMLGGTPYNQTFLLEIGNPFYRNHFLRTWQSERYEKIFIDYRIGLQEGRYSQEFIDEMRHEAFFDVFYECKFPEEDIVDTKGYRVLITNDLFDKSLTDSITTDGELKLGADIGGGGDYNVYIIRNSKNAWIEGANRSDDTMTNVTELTNIMAKYPNLKAENIYIDDIGIGRGVTDRLKEKGIRVNGISVGNPPKDKTRYKNLKAEASWNLKVWLENGGKLIKKEDLRQITWLKYKVDTDKVLSLEPKDELKTRYGKSPDYADALLLTFMSRTPRPDILFV